MKRVVSVSLGSSKRDFTTSATYLGHEFEISRIGTNGDLDAFGNKLQELDGKVDAIGLGGIDLYLFAGSRRYTFRDARKLISRVSKTPVVDGSGLKNTLERETVRWLIEQGEVCFAECNTLVVCAVDRFGLAEEVAKAGGPVIYGDLMFALGIPIGVRSFAVVYALARALLPFVVRMPFKMFYPTGDKQERTIPRFGRAYTWADVIAGDFHMIRRHLPEEPGSLAGKTVLTNTTTVADQDLLRDRGVRRLITTTQSFGGRSAGTNVLEAVLVAAMERPAESLTPADYDRVLSELGWKPQIVDLAVKEVAK